MEPNLIARKRCCAALLALVASACSGSIGSPDGTPGEPSGPGGGGSVSAGGGSGSGSAGGNGATGGGSSVPGPGGSVIPLVAAPANPGAVILRRLNRTEYNNTVADLLGTKLTPAADFPSEDLVSEFDTVGSALSLSPTYVLAYERAAYALVDDLFADATRKARLVPCNVETGGDSCAQTVLSSFARRAWRRPVTATEIAGLLKPIAAAKSLGATATDGLKNAMTATLLSPFFIFKLELDPDLASSKARRLTSHELATRLSYAIWSTMPDDKLTAAADADGLASDEQVLGQVERMLADPRAGALLDTFAAEWFSTKDLETTHDVEASVFPKYTPALARSMRLEARTYINEFLHSTRPVTELLNSRFTFIDSALAIHYGLTRPAGAAAGEFVRVDTTNARAGLMTMGALLTTTSFPSRTSPVKRGEYVFRRLLCDEVPPPPPNVPTLPDAAASSGLTLRQRTELHRKDPNCSGCHNLMDPIGFGLENFDALGAYRTNDGTATIDASGTLPDGTSFNGAIELADIMAKDPRFPACATDKFMIFALGRLLNQADDEQWIEHLAGKSWTANGSLTSIIRTVMMSEVFRSRQPRAM